MAFHMEDGMRKIVRNRSIIIKGFAISCILFIAMSQIVLVGFSSLSHGVNEIDHSLGNIQTIFNNLNNDGHSLSYNGNQISFYLNEASSTCTSATSVKIETELTVYRSGVDGYIYYIEPIPSQIDDCKDFIHDYADKKATNVTYIYYGCTWALILLLALSYHYAIKIFMQFTVFITEASIFLLSGTVFVLMSAMVSSFGIFESYNRSLVITANLYYIIQMYVADFCMDPSQNALKLVHSKNTELVSYYASCFGTNPLFPSLHDITVSSLLLNRSITSLIDNECSGNPYLIKALDALQYVGSNISSIKDDVMCEPIQEDYDNVFHDGICYYSFEGIFYIWLSLFSSCFMLFLVLIFGSILYQYFGPLWGKYIPQEVEWLRLLMLTGASSEYDYMTSLPIPGSGDKNDMDATPLLSNSIPWQTFDNSLSWNYGLPTPGYVNSLLPNMSPSRTPPSVSILREAAKNSISSDDYND
jgi:hypothetical protein